MAAILLQSIAQVRGRKVLVTGALGKTGQAMIDLLSRNGAILFATDQKTEGTLPEGVKDLRPSEDPAVLDEHGIEIVCVSPGVPLTRPLFVAAAQKGLPVIGDLDLGFLSLTDMDPRPLLIALTGTDGKTTTTALLAHLLREAGIPALECGNYGLPFSAVSSPERMQEAPAVLVCECSSYQLEDIHFFRPDVALLLNIAPDHMDRYPTFAAYLAAKLNLFSLQQEGDGAILSEAVQGIAAEEGLSGTVERIHRPGIAFYRTDISSVDQEQIRIGDTAFSWSEFGADSRTNRLNACGAMAALEALMAQGRGVFSSADPSVLRRRFMNGLRSFRGLPHRQERVVTKEGVIYVNDSKATTVHATLSAVQSFPGKKVFLLIGGLEKNTDFSAIREDDRLRLYPFGRAADKIAMQTGVGRRFSSLEEAFQEAVRDARRNTTYYAGESEPDCVILLSPACASQDAYKDYAERGQHFRRLALT